jgi:SAM-dependent methyltransferase
MSIDADAFNAYELSAWDTVADAYIAGFGELTQQSIGPLLDAVELRTGMTFLDVATGPGWLAGAAAERGARVTGVDVSETMLAEARRRYPQLEFEPGSAESLPFADAAFDAVGCNFGMLHFGRPDDAIREVLRVLRPGGRFAFTVWAAPSETVAYEIVLGALQTHGRADVGLPPGPPFFRFSDPTASADALTRAGFVDPRVRTVPQVWRLASAEELFEVMCRGTGRTRGLILGQTAGAREAIRAAIVDQARAHVRDGMLTLPMPSVLSTARKPG